MSDIAKVIFTRNNKVGSLIIRGLTMSNWSHVGNISPDGRTVIEAVGSGVREIPILQMVEHNTDFEIVGFKVPDYKAGWEAGKAQVGKKYDHKAVFSMPFGRDPLDDTDWFCSELGRYILTKSGREFFRSDARRIVPQHLWIMKPDYYYGRNIL